MERPITETFRNFRNISESFRKHNPSWKRPFALFFAAVNFSYIISHLVNWVLSEMIWAVICPTWNKPVISTQVFLCVSKTFFGKYLFLFSFVVSYQNTVKIFCDTIFLHSKCFEIHFSKAIVNISVFWRFFFILAFLTSLVPTLNQCEQNTWFFIIRCVSTIPAMHHFCNVLS